ncbi:MAG: hypothetical protein V3V28_10145 [Polaribacter sp.]|uniref:hypothetical protein n=1 Tax=Polaribacter sp. TaxID=1920175 RepID=UPI002F35DB28
MTKSNKVNSREFYYNNSNKIFFAKILSFVFILILAVTVVYFYNSVSETEEVFNEMQPDYGNEIEKDAEYLLEIFFYLILIMIYFLCFLNFLIKDNSLTKRVAINITVIIAVFFLFIFSAIIANSLIGIPLLLYIGFLIFSIGSFFGTDIESLKRVFTKNKLLL